MNKTAEKLRRERIAARVSQTELALTLRRSQMWVSCLERGRVKITPELEALVGSVIRRLAEVKAESERRRLAIGDEFALPVQVGSTGV